MECAGRTLVGPSAQAHEARHINQSVLALAKCVGQLSVGTNP